MSSARDSRTAAELGRAIAAGKIDPRDLVEEVLAAIAACDDRAIFTILTPERARREAAAAARRRQSGTSAGPLDGVPIAWKDLFDLDGVPTTAGSRVLASAAPAVADAPIVARLAAAGMVTVGRTNMTEFAFSGLGLNPHYGTPVNPYGTGEARIPGGSSSGSAVAVARGLVPVAMGSDTSGSVRIPAAFNGLVGYKASGGRYPMAGVYPLAPSLDTLGPLCRSVEDAVLVDAAMRGMAAPPPAPAALAPHRIVVPTNVVFEEAEPAVTATFEAALERLAAAGIAIDRRALPVLDDVRDLFARHGTLVAAEAHDGLAAMVTGPDAEAIDRRVVARARLGGRIGAEDRAALIAGRTRLMAAAAQAVPAGSLIAFPTVACVAPRLAPLEADDETFFAVNARVLRNTMLASFLDWCGVTIPCGTDADGMPTGFLLNAPSGHDDALLAFAGHVEQAIRGTPG
ncbi:amidase [Tepidamorphus gemmatus]|nr:amidase [Tepidamorphus gemmatus]